MDVDTMRAIAAPLGIGLGFVIGYFVLFKPKKKPDEQ